jgi:hypothetical protein
LIGNRKLQQQGAKAGNDFENARYFHPGQSAGGDFVGAEIRAEFLNDGSNRSTASLHSTAALRGRSKRFERVERFKRERSD